MENDLFKNWLKSPVYCAADLHVTADFHSLSELAFRSVLTPKLRRFLPPLSGEQTAAMRSSGDS